jgi:hypothetical protein
MSLQKQAYWAFGALLALSVLVLFWGLDSGRINIYDEGLYGMYGRTLLKYGVLLHAVDIHGDFPAGVVKFSKPPLSVWAVAASFKLLGPSLFALRFPFALASLFVTLIAFAFGRLLERGALGVWVGFAWGVTWLISYGTYEHGRTATIEPMLLAFVIAALYAYARSQASASSRSRGLGWAALAGLGVAGAFFTKQLVCAIAVVPMLVSEWRLRRSAPRGTQLSRLAIALGVPGVLAGAWLGALYAKVGLSAFRVLWSHAIVRRVSGFDGVHHQNYLNRVAELLDTDATPFSWQLGLIGLGLLWLAKTQKPESESESAADSVGLIGLWFLCSWLAFDVGSRAILPWYALTLLPPLALGHAWLCVRAVAYVMTPDAVPRSSQPSGLIASRKPADSIATAAPPSSTHSGSITDVAARSSGPSDVDADPVGLASTTPAPVARASASTSAFSSVVGPAAGSREPSEQPVDAAAPSSGHSGVDAAVIAPTSTTSASVARASASTSAFSSVVAPAAAGNSEPSEHPADAAAPSYMRSGLHANAAAPGSGPSGVDADAVAPSSATSASVARTSASSSAFSSVVAPAAGSSEPSEHTADADAPTSVRSDLHANAAALSSEPSSADADAVAPSSASRAQAARAFAPSGAFSAPVVPATAGSSARSGVTPHAASPSNMRPGLGEDTTTASSMRSGPIADPATRNRRLPGLIAASGAVALALSAGLTAHGFMPSLLAIALALVAIVICIRIPPPSAARVRLLLAALGGMLAFGTFLRDSYRGTDTDPLASIGEQLWARGKTRVSVAPRAQAHPYVLTTFFGPDAEESEDPPWQQDAGRAHTFEARVDAFSWPNEIAPRKGVEVLRDAGLLAWVGDMTQPPFETEDVAAALKKGPLTFEAEHMASDRFYTLSTDDTASGKRARTAEQRVLERAEEYSLAKGHTPELPRGRYVATFWLKLRCTGYRGESLGEARVLARRVPTKRKLLDCRVARKQDSDAWNPLDVSFTLANASPIDLELRWNQGTVSLDRVSLKRDSSPVTAPAEPATP